MMRNVSDWRPSSWRGYPTRHQPVYQNPESFEAALRVVGALPPLVLADEVEDLKRQLRCAYEGRAFVLQAGDCAEAFDECNGAKIAGQLRVIMQMAALLSRRLLRPTVRIGRIAGQFAKPRSSPTEEIDGRRVPAYMGDCINDHDPGDRQPNPARLLQGYFQASATLNHLRARTSRSGIELYTSHEGLLLPYEERQTHFVEKYNAWYNLGAHMLWIGERTRSISGGHVEYFRGIANPVGIKVGPDADVSEIVALVAHLNPLHVPGKIALITRFGKGRTPELRRLVSAVSSTRVPVLWLCDPMHGNTRVAANGFKTRHVDDVVAEIRDTWEVHRDLGKPLGGLHLELTGEDVTECLGGRQGVTVDQLPENYKSKCDPRLSRSQALEVAEFYAVLGAGEVFSSAPIENNNRYQSNTEAVSKES